MFGSESEQPISCPLYKSPPVVPCDPAELQPLLTHLQSGRAAGGILTFPRGTVTDDGRLDLCKQSLGPAGCRRVTQALEHSRTVVSLLLGTDGIGNTGTADVAQLAEKNSTIEVLYLGCNKIDAAGAASLAASLAAPHSAVSGLWLKRNPLGADGARHLAEMLQTNRTLRTLDLVNTRIGPDGLAALADALTGANQTLERLYLGGNFWGPDEASILAQIVRSAPRLRALLLSAGFLGDGGAAILASALADSRLEELSLASNGVGPNGAAHLFAAAAVHPTLPHLDLGYAVSTRALAASANVIGDEGAASAARCLASDPALVRLNLRGCGVTAHGLDLLTQAMKANTRLQFLMLDRPPCAALEDRLQQNRKSAEILPSVCRDVALTHSVYR